MSKKSLEFSSTDDITEEPIEVRLLSDLKIHKLFKYTVPSSDWIAQINKSLYKQKDISNSIFENHIKYIERILIDQPDYFLEYPNTEALTFLFFDIETLRADYIDKKKIISIAWSFYDGKKHHPVQSTQNTDEKELLEEFLQAVETLDSDIFCGFYHRDFDIPRIIDRCKHHRLDYNRLGREPGTRYTVDHKFHRTNTIVQGRICYDILDSVRADQTLRLKNNKMVTVCKHFNVEGEGWIKEEMSEDTSKIPIEILKLHNEHDILRTQALWQIYWKNIEVQAELFNLPLNLIAEASTQNLIATLFLGRGLFKQGVYSDGMNKDRYPQVFKRKKEKGEKNYEAAIVDIYKTGLIKPVWKSDFSGMYPAIEMTLNLSPETTKISRYLPYKDEFKIEKKCDTTYYFIPDKVIKKVIVVAVNNKKDGFLRKELRKLRKERNIIKDKLKTANDEEKDLLMSQSWNVKILMNIVSGNCGDAISRYGSLPVTIVTVGVGRELIKALRDYINKEYDNACVELDTDGVMMSTQPDQDMINTFIQTFASEKFRITDVSDINVDCDTFKAGYFLKQKNYVLQELNDEIIYHGVSLKSSRQPKMFDSARDTIVDSIFGNDEIDTKKMINEILNMEQYSLSQFSLRTTLHKDFSSYSAGSLQKKLGKQGLTIGIKPEPGIQYEYIKEKNGWKLIQFANIDKLDYKYYEKILAKLFIMFNFESAYKTRQNKSLNEWI